MVVSDLSLDTEAGGGELTARDLAGDFKGGGGDFVALNLSSSLVSREEIEIAGGDTTAACLSSNPVEYSLTEADVKLEVREVNGGRLIIWPDTL